MTTTGTPGITVVADGPTLHRQAVSGGTHRPTRRGGDTGPSRGTTPHRDGSRGMRCGTQGAHVCELHRLRGALHRAVARKAQHRRYQMARRAAPITSRRPRATTSPRSDAASVYQSAGCRQRQCDDDQPQPRSRTHDPQSRPQSRYGCTASHASRRG